MAGGEDMENPASCITDTPLAADLAEDGDNLNACIYASALASFIENADTPVTIGIQGGWGSGKTSLITMLQNKLANDPRHRSICVLVNAWEHSLFLNPDNRAEVALSLMNGLATGIREKVEAILESDACWLDESARETVNPKNDYLESAMNFFGGGVKLLRNVAIQAAANVTGLGDMSGVTKEDGGNRQAISLLAENMRKLRKGLEQMVNNLTCEGRPVKVVLFIDDLDRVPPPTAVEILDITKHLFNFRHCIFVLAIDYEVVVKGLESKFGKKGNKNEREFRQYFDKIIQIPFSMPLGAYGDHISEMLKPAFEKVGYEVNDEDIALLDKIAEDAKIATGGIPRSIKRIVNTLSLLQHIEDAKKGRLDTYGKRGFPRDMEARFIIISMHVNFPEICRRIMAWPDFTEWNAATLNLPWKLNVEDNQKELDALTRSGATKEFFDDDWEKVIYCLCAQSDWLKSQAVKVSRLMNNLLEALNNNEKGKNLSESGLETLEDILDSIKVVSVDSDAGNTLQFDDSSVTTDRVTMFFAQLQDEIAKSPGVVPAHSSEYAKRKDGRSYEIDLRKQDGNLAALAFKWDKNELVIISASAYRHVKTQKEASPVIEGMRGKYAANHKGIEFSCSFEKKMAWDDFTQDREIPEIAAETVELVSAVGKISEALREIKKNLEETGAKPEQAAQTPAEE